MNGCVTCKINTWKKLRQAMFARVAFKQAGKPAATHQKFYSEGSKVARSFDVPGLSPAVVKPVSAPVGPNVDPKKKGAYKVPEYFCYDNMSYFEAEVEMAKFRLPQPSALKKQEH